MRGMNKLMIAGRVGQDPELRMSKQGKPWMRLSVATNRSRRDGDGWVEDTDWHRCKLFGDAAERAEQFVRKGSIVAVEGSMNYEAWTDDEGIKRSKASVLVDRIHFLADLRPAQVAEAK